jgi:superfamily II DNA or RNA helicase
MHRFKLRPYQQDASDAAVDYLTNGDKSRHGLIVAPTGSGKSLLIADIVERLDGETVVFQPSREILKQNAAKLAAYGREPAVFSASLGRREVGQVTLATIGSVVRHPEAFKGVRYVLIDECHGVNAKGGMFKTFLDAVSGARFLGLTATPYRLATNSLGAGRACSATSSTTRRSAPSSTTTSSARSSTSRSRRSTTGVWRSTRRAQTGPTDPSSATSARSGSPIA